MAEEALKKLEEQLNCSICLETYTDPKQLSCNHVYCRNCLVRLVVRDQQGQLDLPCPTCRQVTPIPARGVAGLQSAFHINHLLEIRDSVKKIRTPSIIKEEVVEDAMLNEPSESVITPCHEHAKEMELYCETCGELICFHCAIKGGSHHSHNHELLNEAFQKYKGEITSSLEPMEKQLMTINKALTQLDTRHREISNQQAAIESDIHNTVMRLHKAVDVRKTKLISQLHQMTLGKLKKLAAQRDQVETTQAQISSCLHLMKESFKTGNQREVLMMKTTLVQQVKELTTMFQPEMLGPNTEADMTFSFSTDITAMCQTYGQVFTPYLPDPCKSHATSEVVEVASIAEKSTAVIQAINFQGTQCEETVSSLECEIVSEITGTRSRGNVERIGMSQYVISYQPTIKGRQQLHIQIENQHIRGSPFHVIAKSPAEQLGTLILTLGELNRPEGVAITQGGEVFVSENMGHCVSVFSPRGEKIRSFGAHGTGRGQFVCPSGVAVDAEGNILVADSNNHRIQKFTALGQFITAVGTQGRGPLQFNHPKGIAFNASCSKVYVVDGQNDCIQILNSDLTFSGFFGKEGNGKGQLCSPTGISCDSTGKIYVADSLNDRVQVFTAEGKFLRMFWKCGYEEELRYPFGTAVDTNGLVYISEYNNNRVSLFTSEGRFVASFGQRGDGPGEFKYPRGLAVDNSGVVYVCDRENSRVQMF